jgi:4'-phosphopantetheinyl transferase
MTISERRGMALPLSPKEKAERLTKIWCLKEAYVKAIGEGVGFGLQRIDVSLSDDGALRGVKADGKVLEEGGWSVELGILEEGYIWACITESSERLGDPRIVPYQDIINVMLS